MDMDGLFGDATDGTGGTSADDEGGGADTVPPAALSVWDGTSFIPTTTAEDTFDKLAH